MKTLVITFMAATALTFASCEKCYKCEGVLGIEYDCCGDKDECEGYRADCEFAGGRIK